MIIKGFSIIICCYNSANRLPETLRHIAELQIPEGVPCELIIVNNACTDDTEQTAIVEWHKYQTVIDFSIIQEPVQGLSYARKKGFSAARYEFIVLCDDDNWLSSKYLVRSLQVFNEHQNIGVLGGNGLGICEIDPPDWLQLIKLFATGEQAPHSGPVEDKKVYGAGAILRKSAYQKLLDAGFKCLLTDRLKDLLSSGGDFELCYAIYLAGYEIWYDHELTFKHYFPKERLTISYYYNFIHASVKCLSVLDGYKIHFSNKAPDILYINSFLIKQLFHCKKEYLYYKAQTIRYPATSTKGIYARFRTKFFSLRIKSIYLDYYNVHVCVQNTMLLKKKLKALKTRPNFNLIQSKIKKYNLPFHF